jgi:hypothetical protein
MSIYIFPLKNFKVNEQENFQTNSTVTSVKNKKAQFQVAFRRCLSTHSFTLLMKILCVKMIHNTVPTMFTLFCPVAILHTLHGLKSLCYDLFKEPRVSDKLRCTKCVSVLLLRSTDFQSS